MTDTAPLPIDDVLGPLSPVRSPCAFERRRHRARPAPARRRGCRSTCSPRAVGATASASSCSEPRRMAARAAADRMAWLLGGQVGETIG